MSVHIRVPWDWADTKVHPAVRYPSSWVADADDPKIEEVIGMIKNFNPRVVTPKDVIHSLNDGNQGMVSKYPEYYIDITVNPYGRGYEILTSCQNGDRYFDVVLSPITDHLSAGGTGEEAEVGQPEAAWGAEIEVYKGCKVTDMSSRYAMGTEPTVTFTCRALRFAWKDEGKEFGNGYQGRSMSKETLGLVKEPTW